MDISIAGIRQDYKHSSLSENDVRQDPIEQFSVWWTEAVNSQLDEVNAMTLATSSADGIPSARIVLLKGFDTRGFVFYTNYNSLKGKMLEENPRACLVFFWKELQRQVRITGLVERVSGAESDQYFQSRPAGSRIGAIVSPQSTVIESREWLEERVLEAGSATGNALLRPAYWGGYRVKPVTIEFWQGRESRLHDRIQYNLSEENLWKIERLAP